MTAAGVAAQGAAFLEWAAAGAALGLLYDLLRAGRERRRGRWLNGTADLLFWLTAALSLFAFALLRGNGVIRLFHGAAFLLGGGIYFLVLSPMTLPLFRLLGEGRARLGRLFAAPGKMLIKNCKKLLKKQKKDFQNWFKWYRINVVYHPEERLEGGSEQP